MKSVTDLQKELYNELSSMTIEEIEGIRTEWIENAKSEGLSGFIITYINGLCDKVVKEKQEETA